MSKEADITAVYVFLPTNPEDGLVHPITCIGRAALEKEVALWEYTSSIEKLTEPQRLELTVIVNDLIDTNQYRFDDGRVVQCHRVRLPARFDPRMSKIPFHPLQESSRGYLARLKGCRYCGRQCPHLSSF